MGGDRDGVFFKPQSISSLPFIFFLIFSPFNYDFSKAETDPSSTSSSMAVFSPPDSYLIDCGSTEQTKLSDGRTFKSERDTSSLLSTDEDIEASADTITATASPSIPSSSFPLFLTAKIFTQVSTYTFHISQTGKHWVRLYFYPLPHPTYNLTDAVFKVTAAAAESSVLLLDNFSVTHHAAYYVLKEYLVQANSNRFSLIFKPEKNSFAFINAIEVVSAPDSLNVPDSASAFQVHYRLNVGGPSIFPNDDTLSRTWESDSPYNSFPQGSKNVSVSPKTIKYPDKNGSNPLVAPSSVYSSGQELQDSQTMESNFNLTWKMNVEEGFDYLIRLHFCDIISKALNTLYFNVYINNGIALPNLDLSSITGSLSSAYYRDFVVSESNIVNRTIKVQIGVSDIQSGIKQAILNGLEVMKMSDRDNRLDGGGDSKGLSGSSGRKRMGIVAGVGLAMAVAAMVLLGAACVRWKRKPEGGGWEKRNSFTSWLLPMHNGTNFVSSKSSSRRSSIFGSRKSKSTYSSFFSSSGCFGRFFTLAELQTATQNFDDKAVIGVGGFGKVYLGVLDDGTDELPFFSKTISCKITILIF